MKCTQTVNWRILTHDFQRKYRDWFLGACVYIFIKQWLHYHLQASSYFNSCPNRLHLFSLTFSKENGHIHPYKRKLVKKKWSKEKKSSPLWHTVAVATFTWSLLCALNFTPSENKNTTLKCHLQVKFWTFNGIFMFYENIFRRHWWTIGSCVIRTKFVLRHIWLLNFP